MPIYDFVCEVCGDIQEAVQSYKEAPPQCCGQPMKRGIGGLAYWQWKNDPNGSTPGTRKYAQELTNKHRK